MKRYYYEVEMGNGLVFKSKSFETKEELEAFDFQPVCEQFCESLKEIRLIEKTIRKHVIGKKAVGFNDDGVVAEDVTNVPEEVDAVEAVDDSEDEQ